MSFQRFLTQGSEWQISACCHDEYSEPTVDARRGQSQRMWEVSNIVLEIHWQTQTNRNPHGTNLVSATCDLSLFVLFEVLWQCLHLQALFKVLWQCLHLHALFEILWQCLHLQALSNWTFVATLCRDDIKWISRANIYIIAKTNVPFWAGITNWVPWFLYRSSTLYPKNGFLIWKLLKQAWCYFARLLCIFEVNLEDTCVHFEK